MEFGFAKFSKLLQEPSFLIGSALVIILSYLVIAPIVSIFSNSVSLTMMDAMLSGGKDGEFTYKYVDRVFTSSISEKIFWVPLKNSLTVSFFATIIPAERSGEFFGFFNMFGKAGAFIGPTLVGVALSPDNIQLGLLPVILLFVLGGIVLILSLIHI